MSFRLRWTREAADTFGELQRAAEQAAQSRTKAGGGPRGKRRSKSSKQEGLFKQVAKAIRLLAENPRHNSLNTHEYDSLDHPFDPHGKVSEAYAQNRTPGAYRVFWCYRPESGDITIIAITPHP
jgi:hypothetical protein